MQIVAGAPAKVDKHPDYPDQPHTLIIEDKGMTFLCQVIPVNNPASTNTEAWKQALVIVERIKSLLETSLKTDT